MAAKVKWWETAEEPDTVWRACVTDDGIDYYVNTETNETSWEMPEELMSSDDRSQAGEWLWVPDKVEAFVAVRKVGEGGSGKVSVEWPDGKVTEVKKKDCTPLKRTSLKRLVEDLTLLDDMSPQLILHNLRARFKQSDIYTNVGNILISVNPYQRLPIYTADVVRRYKEGLTASKDLPAHVFNVAHDAYYGVTSFDKLQSIIISGESGAGKTEATKQCLQYIASIAGSVGGVENKILMANPLLEAYGNAKTLRNDNSSRFGKYMEVYLDGQGRINSCATRNYLLEKIRVSQTLKGERNFHIFYQLVKAVNAGDRGKLQLLDDPKAYKYLETCTDVPTLDDPKDFADVEKAYGDLGFSNEDRLAMYTVVSAIMALGNIEFEEGKPDEAKVCEQSSGTLGKAAEMLQVDAAVLSKSLVSREIRVRGQEATTAFNDVKAATNARHALAKFVYSKMFDWLVGRVNKSMGGGASSRYIGILDIFGFEILRHNSFEQLCINYTNEMLQQHFNNNTFKLEQEIYKAEGLDVAHIDFIDNAPMIALITEKRIGTLDEELKVPGGSDKGFLEKVAENQRSNKVYTAGRKDPMYFTISHYAGDVDYDGAGFLEKNRDTLNTDLLEMLEKSTLPLMKELYPPASILSALDRKSSLGKQFKEQLDSLMAQLYKTDPHYIRCIKPNEEKAALTFVAQNCYEQLTYCGVFEAVAIRKQGYPFRLPHKEFAERYVKICSEELADGLDTKGQCKAILKQMKLSDENCKLGRSRVLYRALEYRKLELDWSIVTKNERILKELERLCAIDVTSMSKADKETYIMELAAAVRESDLFRIKTAVAEKGRKLLEKFIEERVPKEVKERLSVAKAEMDRGELEELIEMCDREGYIIKIVRECRELLEEIIDADDALTLAMQKMDEQFLQKALKMCDDFGYKGPLVKEAAQMLKRLKKAKQALEKALTPPPRQHLVRKAIKACEAAGYVQDYTRYDECVRLLSHLERTDALLEAAKDSWDIPKLEAALLEADKPQFLGRPYECDLVDECRDSLKKVIFLTGECARAITQCIEAQVYAVVKRGNELNVQTDPLDKLRMLVNGDYKDFLAEQFKRAKKCADHARAVRVMVKRADLRIQSRASGFEVNKFDGLKKPKDWGAEKQKRGMGLLSAGMLRYQDEPLHAPVTIAAAGGAKPGVIASVHSKMFAAKFAQAFATVQLFMGQGAAAATAARKDAAGAAGGPPTDLAAELHALLCDAVKHKMMRDEVYLYIIKQCSSNPAKRGARPIEAAWELLAFCLTVFPPSKGFEGHLEHWIRRSEFNGNDKFCCRGLLRRRVYEGVDEDFPTVEELRECATASAYAGGGGSSSYGGSGGGGGGDGAAPRTVTLDRSVGKKLGIRLGDAKRKCAVPIVWVDSAGQAAGQLTTNDSVVEINGNDVRGKSSAKAGKFVKEAEAVVLTLGDPGAADDSKVAAASLESQQSSSSSSSKGKRARKEEEAATAAAAAQAAAASAAVSQSITSLCVVPLLPPRLRLHEFDEMTYVPRAIEDTGPDLNSEVACQGENCKRPALTRTDTYCFRCQQRADAAAAAAAAAANGGAAAAAAGDVGGPLWQAIVDPGSGRTYYYNATTQITQWEVPGESAA